MVDSHVVAGVVATLLTLGNQLYYLHLIVKGVIKPHAFPLFVWTVVTFIVFAGMVGAEAGPALWRTGVCGVLCLITTLFCLRNGFDYVRRFDVLVLAGALMAVPVWLLTGDADTALLWTLVVEVLGTLPAIRKAYMLPDEDSVLAWNLSAVGQLISVAALTQLRLPLVLYFVVWAVMCFAAALVLVLRRRKLI